MLAETANSAAGNKKSCVKVYQMQNVQLYTAIIIQHNKYSLYNYFKTC